MSCADMSVSYSRISLLQASAITGSIYKMRGFFIEMYRLRWLNLNTIKSQLLVQIYLFRAIHTLCTLQKEGRSSLRDAPLPNPCCSFSVERTVPYVGFCRYIHPAWL